MSAIVGTNIGAPIYPTDTADTYPSHDANYGKGGLHYAADTTARDAVTTDRRYEGMMVYVAANNKTYQLVGGITNSDWVAVITGAGGVDGSGSTDRLTYWTDTDTISYVPIQYYDSSDVDMPNTIRYYAYSNDGTEWPSWGLHTISDSPAVGDVLGEYKITGYNSVSDTTEYAVVRGKIGDPTDGAEYGKMYLQVMQNGSVVTALIAQSDMDSFGNEGIEIPGRLIVGSTGISSSSIMEVYGSGKIEIRVDDTMEIWTDVDMEGNPIDNTASLTLDSKTSVDTPAAGRGRLWYAGANEELIMTVFGSQRAIILGPDDQASTNHALARWDNTRGSLVQDSMTTLDDSGNMETATVASTQIGIRYETGDGHIDAHVNTDGTSDIESFLGLTISCSCSGDITLDAEDIYLNASSGNDVIVQSGANFQLGNEYTGGAPTPAGYLVVKDSLGNSYKIPAEAV